jgi:hypothetical protein
MWVRSLAKRAKMLPPSGPSRQPGPIWGERPSRFSEAGAWGIVPALPASADGWAVNLGNLGQVAEACSTRFRRNERVFVG